MEGEGGTILTPLQVRRRRSRRQKREEVSTRPEGEAASVLAPNAHLASPSGSSAFESHTYAVHACGKGLLKQALHLRELSMGRKRSEEKENRKSGPHRIRKRNGGAREGEGKKG